jgi:hypothetical protein
MNLSFITRGSASTWTLYSGEIAVAWQWEKGKGAYKAYFLEAHEIDYTMRRPDGTYSDKSRWEDHRYSLKFSSAEELFRWARKKGYEKLTFERKAYLKAMTEGGNGPGSPEYQSALWAMRRARIAALSLSALGVVKNVALDLIVGSKL